MTAKLSRAQRSAISSRTEAAEIMAIDVVVFARTHGAKITQRLCEERVGEWRGKWAESTTKGQAAQLANPKTVLRIASRYWHEAGSR